MIKKIHNKIFKTIHNNQLIYNTCWEDPRLDREALDLNENSKVVMITSAGCNALDYILAGAGEVHAIDMNHKQNALLELKIAAIRGLEFEDFFQIFGKGKHVKIKELYLKNIRGFLSEEARQYWDKAIKLFSGTGLRNSFYYRGSSGCLAGV